MWEKIAILGPGLIGGSIALALHERELCQGAAVWGRSESSIEAVRLSGIADIVSTDLSAVVKNASLVVLATPIGAMPSLLGQALPHLPPSALVTDVGSVKGGVVHSLDALCKGKAHFIGGHPMAGSEKTGFDAARADLFEGAVCLLTPVKSTDVQALARVRDFWEQLGCRVSEVAPEAHDEIVARISHFPHLIAALLVNTSCQNDANNSLQYCGNGFRDTTRIASIAVEMWTEIILSNRKPLCELVGEMICRLESLSKILKSGDSEQLAKCLSEARQWRNQL